MIVLALLEERQRHGYELAKLIESSPGASFIFMSHLSNRCWYRMERQRLVEASGSKKPASGGALLSFFLTTGEAAGELAGHRPG